MRPIGIRETLHQSLNDLDIIAARDQENRACGNLHLCVVLETGIEGETHAVGERRKKRGGV